MMLRIRRHHGATPLCANTALAQMTATYQQRVAAMKAVTATLRDAGAMMGMAMKTAAMTLTLMAMMTAMTTTTNAMENDPDAAHKEKPQVQ